MKEKEQLLPLPPQFEKKSENSPQVNLSAGQDDASAPALPHASAPPQFHIKVNTSSATLETSPAPYQNLPSPPPANGSEHKSTFSQAPETGDQTTGTELTSLNGNSVPEYGGSAGPEPTRYGDWEHKGRCSDF